MGNGFFQVPLVTNEPVKSYAPGTPERDEVLKTYQEMFNTKVDLPLFIDGEEIRTGNTKRVIVPHDHQHDQGVYHLADESHIKKAIAASVEGRKKWAKLPWEERAAVFLKAADLITGPYRQRMNAATMIGQGKNIYQAEIEAACEIADFFRFNVEYMAQIFEDQPNSSMQEWNRMEYRGLEGFIYAVAPFNFTAISGNLPAAPALMGNAVVWKPSDNQVLAANVTLEVFREAGVPDGVINLVMGDPEMITNVVLDSPEFAGIHYTGSTTVFKGIWKKIGDNINKYKSYPRIVGETGGKDFIVAHPSANPKQISTAMSRGAFEYQGQKCSAASRCYLPKSLWPTIKEQVIADVRSFKMGSPEDMGNFINAVIHERSFDKLAKYIDQAKKDKNAEIIVGGNYDKSKGWFVEPTIIVTADPHYTTMETELFGPVLTVYVYDDKDWEETLHLVDETSPYALTGAIFSKDRYAAAQATDILEHAAGNFYVNDKPTGAVIDRQPFGGGRESGTNDKAGSKANILRWTSMRVIKETFVAAKDYRYPFLGEE